MERQPGKGPGKAETILLAEVAREYYFGGRSKTEIAKDFALSRFSIARMLDDARTFGVVNIEIRDPSAWSSASGEQIASFLGVQSVQVVATDPSDASEGAERLGRAVFHVLRQLIRPNMTLGISWSRTLELSANFIPELPPCDIVQLAGAVQGLRAGNLLKMITEVGQSPGIHTWPIFAPLVVDEAPTARDLKRQPEIAETLQKADSLDLAVVAIGAWSPGESTVWDKVSTTDRASGTAAGAVAEISGRLISSDGVAIHTALDDRIIGVTIDQLARAQRVIAVAHGAGRVNAVRAAVRAGIVDRLVVDSALGEALINEFQDG